ncbi:MAG: hypothetical protein AMJ41_05115 [candidate division Zixibacteria bacterium DG_27]|nr:MAG: hypothetical protein AMJ41_05115 [candidate division Zixibacteria bacterium DG_27]
MQLKDRPNKKWDTGDRRERGQEEVKSPRNLNLGDHTRFRKRSCNGRLQSLTSTGWGFAPTVYLSMRKKDFSVKSSPASNHLTI